MAPQHCVTSLAQVINFTTISEILIDIRVDIEEMSAVCPDSFILSEIYHYNGGYHSLFDRYFQMGDLTGTRLYLDEPIDVSAYSGIGELILRSEVLGDTGCGGGGEGTLRGAVMYDNLREIASESAAAAHQRFTGGLLHRSVH